MLNQAIKECFKEMIKHVRRVILCKTSICKGFLLAIKDLSKVQSNDQDKFLSIKKTLIPVADGSTGLMNVTTPLLLLHRSALKFTLNLNTRPV